MRHLSKTLLFAAALSIGHLPADARQPEEETGEAEEAEESEGAPAESEPPQPPGDETAAGESAATSTDESSAQEAPADDLEQLRAEYFKLRDKLFQSRARASAVASALYSTRISIGLHYASGRYYTVTRSSIRLDGANVFDDSEGLIAADKAPRFEGYIAPGRHQLTIRIEATGKDDDRFTSVIENSFVVQAIKGKDLQIKATASDEGNIAYAWSKRKKGSYKLNLDVKVKSVKRDGKKSDHIQRTGRLGKHAPAKKRSS